MKRTKLHLSRDTIRNLSTHELDAVAGGIETDTRVSCTGCTWRTCPVELPPTRVEVGSLQCTHNGLGCSGAGCS